VEISLNQSLKFSFFAILVKAFSPEKTSATLKKKKERKGKKGRREKEPININK